MPENIATTNQDLTHPNEEIHPVIKGTGDFSDRLSPMLVKELRQGLKGISFVILFIAIQVILGFFILTSSFSPNYDDTGQSISTFVFFLLCMATLIAQPIRGISAISSEIKENTIDLMVMTRLSAWKIVYGKWISIVSQSALMVAAVAPYLIVRYYFGGMQLFPEIMVLISILILSACFTAMTVGLSALPSLLLKGLFSMGLLLLVFSVCAEIFNSRRDYQNLLDICGFSSKEDSSIYIAFLIGFSYIAWLALDFGASNIAPAAENRTTPRRLVTLGIMALIAGIICLFGNTNISEALSAFLTLAAIPACVICLTEPIQPIPKISMDFLRKPAPLRLSRYIFYPGWHAGIIYFLLLYLICAVTAVFTADTTGYDHSQEAVTIITTIFGCLLFPLAITKLFFARKHNLLPYYFGTALAMGLIFLLLMVVINITRTDDLAITFCWLPPMQLYLHFEASSYGKSSISENSVMTISILCFALYWTICFLRSLSAWKLTKNNEHLASEILAQENKSSSTTN